MFGSSRGIIVSLAAAALLSACGGSAAPTSSSAPASTAPASSAAASSAASSSSASASSAPAASASVLASAAPSAAASGAAASASGSAGAAAKPSAPPPPPITAIEVKTDAKLGKFLADQRGMTLYIFTKDTKGVSNCTGGCAAAWPPAIATAAPTLPSGTSGALDLITRPDGPTKQITYNGLPLYFFAADTAAGDTKGEGVANSWHVAAVTAG